ncbi:hypothetical protein NX059_006038 [Plenodomus lindquistii]|nr:hypothetical protein NX059_006038 [Plenodomus lindquistii]
MSLITRAKPYLIHQAKYAHLNAFNSLNFEALVESGPHQQGPLNVQGMPIAVKDNICTTDLKTTASSALLKDFTSPYDATVVTLLKDAGAAIIGKTNMDEFGMGSHSTNSHFGPVKMQRFQGEEASAGGSSGGSALAVASGQCWAALGTDTGGSVRLPAAYTGVIGFKPSYGRLSRWGVIPYANSLDTVGILGRTVQAVKTVYGTLDVHDPRDPTSLTPATRFRLGKHARRPQRIGVPLDYNIATLHPLVRKAWFQTLRNLQAAGHTIHPVRLPSTQHALSAYYVLAPAEASSNLAKYDGVRFGSRAQGIDGTPESVLFARTRGQGFGQEVQRRILLGAFSLSAQAIDNYFIQAQKIRRLVQKDFDSVFAAPNPLLERLSNSEQKPKWDMMDALICPTAPTLAPPLSDVKDQDPLQAYMNDVFTVPASLAGLPAISVPVPIEPEADGTGDSEPDIVRSAGIQIIGQFGDDRMVLDLAAAIAKTCEVDATYRKPAWRRFALGELKLKEQMSLEHFASKHGLSSQEAKPEYEAKLANITAAITEARSDWHLDLATRLWGQTREQYMANFIDEIDPVAAEARRFDQIWKLTRWRSGQVVRMLKFRIGNERLEKAAALFGVTKAEYIQMFVECADPVEAEAAAFEAKKKELGMTETIPD